MNKNEMTTNELQEIMIEANLNTNGAFDNIIKYEESDFWDNFAAMEYEPQDIALMVAYGSYKPYHDFIGFDGYGNIESMTEEEYRQELLEYYEEYSEEV